MLLLCMALPFATANGCESTTREGNCVPFSGDKKFPLLAKNMKGTYRNGKRGGGGEEEAARATPDLSCA